MKQAQEPGKRIVSKGEYAKTQGKRASIGLAGIGLYLSAAGVVFFGMCLTEMRWKQYTRVQLYQACAYQTLSDFVNADNVETGISLQPKYVDYSNPDYYGYEIYLVKQEAKAVSRPTWWVQNLAGLLTLTLLTDLIVRMTWASMKRVENITIGVPLTRANAADLPAPDSLVRASSEPLQAQEGVLLRAAAEGQERHEEQLVRASVGVE